MRITLVRTSQNKDFQFNEKRDFVGNTKDGTGRDTYIVLDKDT